MFDFAVTGKPMVFFTYDLEDYRDAGRGFYFDLEAEAPGAAVPHDRGGRPGPERPRPAPREHAQAYRRFHDTYCYLDDGHAAKRVVQRVFG